MKPVLERVLDRHDLEEKEAGDLLRALVSGQALPAFTGALLAGLRVKGEAAAELRGFARAMREMARKPAIPSGASLVDTAGTGGDGSHSFNLSTGAALLAAACGCRVVKHGNRAVSSRSGSADVLEALGVPLPMDEVAAGACLADTGFTFLFAPYYHAAMQAVAPIRAALGVRTIFNLVGPISNPAQPAFQVVGAYSEASARLLAEALEGMEIERAFVVHGDGGWDEPTPVGPFLLLDVRPGRTEERIVDPAAYGIARCRAADLRGRGGRDNAAGLRAVFEGGAGAHRDALVLGAALVLQLTGEVRSPREAAAAAAAAIDSGRAAALLDHLSGWTHG